MRNWMLLLAFNGTAYRGWQIQPQVPTVEGTLEQALSRLTQQHIKVHGAGRTDAGVHGLNYPASFELDTALTPEKIRVALNALLPHDIVVKAVQEVPQEVHARHSAVGKRYRYQIHNLSYADPFRLQQSWWVRRSLDLDAMREAALLFLGVHDFRGFRSVHCTSSSTIKEMREAELRELRPGVFCLEFEANSFLQHMVRILTGTLVEVGLGRCTQEDIREALSTGQRKLVGQTAPAHGLAMLRTLYPEGLISWPAEALDP
jgi:tRNA pseudouridine38-40 synthase